MTPLATLTVMLRPLMLRAMTPNWRDDASRKQIQALCGEIRPRG